MSTPAHGRVAPHLAGQIQNLAPNLPLRYLRISRDVMSALLAWLLTALSGCAGLTLPMIPTARQHAHPMMAIGDVPPGFLGEDQLGDWVNLKKSTDLGAAATMGLPERAVALLNKVQADSGSISFDEVISVIDECFDVSPTQVRVPPLPCRSVSFISCGVTL